MKKFDKDLILEALTLMYAMAQYHGDEIQAFRHKVANDRIITKFQANAMSELIEQVHPGSHQGKAKIRVLGEWIKANGPVPDFVIIEKNRDKADVLCHSGPSLEEAEAELATLKQDGGNYRLNKSTLTLIFK